MRQEGRLQPAEGFSLINLMNNKYTSYVVVLQCWNIAARKQSTDSYCKKGWRPLHQTKREARIDRCCALHAHKLPHPSTQGRRPAVWRETMTFRGEYEKEAPHVRHRSTDMMQITPMLRTRPRRCMTEWSYASIHSQTQKREVRRKFHAPAVLPTVPVRKEYEWALRVVGYRKIQTLPGNRTRW